MSHHAINQEFNKSSQNFHKHHAFLLYLDAKVIKLYVIH